LIGTQILLENYLNSVDIEPDFTLRWTHKARVARSVYSCNLFFVFELTTTNSHTFAPHHTVIYQEMSSTAASSGEVGFASGHKGSISFDPNKSNVSAEVMNVWLNSPITHQTHVPGLGPKGLEAFKSHGIDSIFQLLGKFLSLHGNGASSVNTCQAFFDWLGETGLPSTGSSKHAVTRSIAEKCQNLLPSLAYDANAYNSTNRRA